MAAAVVVLLAVLLIWSVAVGGRRLRQRAQARPAVTSQTQLAPDLVARLLVVAVWLLPAGRRTWGQAMLSELAQIDSGPERRRFAIGCCVVVVPMMFHGRSDRLMTVALLAQSSLCVVLVGYGLLRYPGIMTGPGSWLAVLAFVAVLVAYTAVATVVARRSKRLQGSALGTALTGALAIVGAWVLVAVDASRSFALDAIVVPVVVLGAPVVVGAVGMRWAVSKGGGCQEAVLLPAVFAGLLIFLVAAGDAVATGGRPYDSGQVRDFASSRMHDMATYAVSDDLGTAMMLLLMVPLLVVVLATLGARLAGPRRSASNAGSS